MLDDSELLRAYAESGSNPAFAELVGRHLPAVYGTCLRRCGSRSLAEEAAQRVFIDLARKARSLRGHKSLSGWLFVSARYASAGIVRSELRRSAALARAAEAMSTEPFPASGDDGADLPALLDPMLERLGARDREILLLRFYRDQSYPDIGRTLGLGESGARMRVERALERLRGEFNRRSIATSGAALAAALTANGSTIVPPALTAATLSQATAAGAALSISSLALMASTTLKITTALSLAALLATGYYAHTRLAALQQRNARLGTDLEEAREQVRRLATQVSHAQTMSVATPGSVLVPPRGRPSTEEMLSDHPSLRPVMARMARREIERFFGAAINTLNLPSDKAKQLRDLIYQKETAFSDARQLAEAQGVQVGTEAFSQLVRQVNQSVDAQIASLVTSDQLAQIESTAKTESQVSQIQSQIQNYAWDLDSAGLGLSADQQVTLTNLATKDLLPNTSNMSQAAARPFMDYDPQTDLRLADVQFLQDASSVVTPDQLSALQQSIADQHRWMVAVRDYGAGGSLPTISMTLRNPRGPRS